MYPKPGTPNPLVTLFVFDTEQQYIAPVEQTWDGRLPIDDSIIFEVNWVSKTELIVKEVGRSGQNSQVFLFDVSLAKANELHGGPSAKGRIVRKLGRMVSRVIMVGLTMYFTPRCGAFFHSTAFFPNADSTHPFWLTRGDWEVTGPIEGVNEEKGIV